MKKLISILLVLVAVSGVSAELIELTYHTSIVYSSDPTFEKYDIVTYVFRYDTELPAKMTYFGEPLEFSEFSDENGLIHKSFFAEIVSSAFSDAEDIPPAMMGDSYNIGVNVTGEDNTIVDAFFYIGTDYHTINIYTESHNTVGTDNGISSWATDESLNLKIVETIVHSESHTDIVITHFPIRVPPPPPPPPPPPEDVPEPSVATSLLLGVAFLSGTVVRRFLKK